MARSFKIKLLLLVAISGSSLHCEQTLYDQTIINIAGYSLLTSSGIGALTGCVQGLKGTKAPVLACGAASASSTAVVAVLLIKIITKTDNFNEGLKFVIEQNLDDVKCIAGVSCLGTAALSYLITHSSASAVRSLLIVAKNASSLFMQSLYVQFKDALKKKSKISEAENKKQ